MRSRADALIQAALDEGIGLFLGKAVRTGIKAVSAVKKEVNDFKTTLASYGPTPAERAAKEAKKAKEKQDFINRWGGK